MYVIQCIIKCANLAYLKMLAIIVKNTLFIVYMRISVKYIFIAITKKIVFKLHFLCFVAKIAQNRDCKETPTNVQKRLKHITPPPPQTERQVFGANGLFRRKKISRKTEIKNLKNRERKNFEKFFFKSVMITIVCWVCCLDAYIRACVRVRKQKSG